MAWVRAKPTRAMRRHIVYAPFPVKHGVRPLGISWESKSKFIVRRYDRMSTHLSDLDPQQDVLYIVGHCCAGGRSLSDNAHEEIDASRLARRVYHEGLKQNHRTIRLYACQGAAAASPHLPSFHSQFFAQLKAIGYWDVELSGYLTTVSSVLSDGHRYGQNHLNQIIGRARQFRISSANMAQGGHRGLAPRR